MFEPIGRLSKSSPRCSDQTSCITFRRCLGYNISRWCTWGGEHVEQQGESNMRKLKKMLNRPKKSTNLIEPEQATKTAESRGQSRPKENGQDQDLVRCGQGPREGWRIGDKSGNESKTADSIKWVDSNELNFMKAKRTGRQSKPTPKRRFQQVEECWCCDSEGAEKGLMRKQADRGGWDARDRTSRGARARREDARRSRRQGVVNVDTIDQPQVKLEGECWVSKLNAGQIG